jgi:VWFA-related protein
LLLALFLGLALTVAGRAQTQVPGGSAAQGAPPGRTPPTPGSQQPAPAQPPETPQPPPIFRAGVTLVTTDIIARDRRGQFVADVNKDEFEVYENGQLQEIASLVLVHGGRVYNQLLPPPPVQEGIILPASRPTSDTAGRIFVLFIDDLHLSVSSTPRVRQVYKRIVDTLIHEGDLFGIVSTGPSSIRVDLTYDRSRLYGAMEKITGDALNPEEIIRAPAGPQGPTELRYRAHVAFKTARELVANMEEVQNRRKAVIYFSNGYDFDPFPESRREARLEPLRRALSQDDLQNIPEPAYDPFERITGQDPVFSDADLQMELTELTRAANRANASFYSVDPRGLVAGPDLDIDIPTQEWNQYVFKTQNSLRVLAELTGGIAVVNRNDFENAMKQIDAETSDYYVLGFYTNNPDPTVRTRRLEVKVKRDGVDVRSRTHYTLPRTVAAAAPNR